MLGHIYRHQIQEQEAKHDFSWSWSKIVGASVPRVNDAGAIQHNCG
jgi:hypothetical protein